MSVFFTKALRTRPQISAIQGFSTVLISFFYYSVSYYFFILFFILYFIIIIFASFVGLLCQCLAELSGATAERHRPGITDARCTSFSMEYFFVN